MNRKNMNLNEPIMNICGNINTEQEQNIEGEPIRKD